MIFRIRRKIDLSLFKINNNEIANVNQFCFLGIIIYENLTMQNHVEMVYLSTKYYINYIQFFICITH